MREGTEEKKGIDYINDAIERLSVEHMELYGEGNKERMSEVNMKQHHMIRFLME